MTKKWTDTIATLLSNDPTIMATGTLTTSSTTVPADTGRTEASNYWNGDILIPLTGAVALQPRKIASFNNTGGVFTLETPLTAAPGQVGYVIVPASGDSKTYQKDVWCTAQTNAAVITTPGAEWVLPNVVVGAQGAADGLPLGAVVTEAKLLLMFDLLDTSAAANYIETAGDGIYFKISTETHYVHLCAFTSVAGDWYTPASGMSGQVVIGTTDLVNATYGVTVTGTGTYNIMSPETTETIAKAITAHGATMVLKNLRTGIRLFYRMPQEK